MFWLVSAYREDASMVVALGQLLTTLNTIRLKVIMSFESYLH